MWDTREDVPAGEPDAELDEVALRKKEEVDEARVGAGDGQAAATAHTTATEGAHSTVRI